ncbi:MAG: 4-hydroxythreonine-4-phosphate dehydrogenase PdxA [Desulfobacterales bacterium C00003060]|nr:MAG: 4-hydroxythreonine-4-phosphate dehydrogenase PdxA [Desulfobacterales bacterium C00003060]OEU83459.1 MAG: 4-hydroxythreonine-4-phosphate dehydrogenase PdxA [Desulfobacterales bacterium S5133MH4]
MKGVTKRPIIGITMGDPVGIGPEIILKAFAEESVYEVCRPIVLGDIAVMMATNQWLRSGLRISPVDTPEAGLYQSGSIDVIGLSDLDYGQLQYGHPTQKTGRAMVVYVTQGIDWAMEERIHGLATCPINKLAMHVAGVDLDGHTELLAQRTKTSDYVMMLAGSRLRVALVTIHVPLAQVPGSLTTEAIFKTIRITKDALRNSFGISAPKLAVAALNPHAGENGLFGDEEPRVILPAIHQAARAGIDVSGPYPPDTLFYLALKGTWDAVICMYHDQGLIPFKMVHFSDGVNTTLGLPIVRTSVDHGTAYDIAGKGKADSGSLVAAVRMAAQHAISRMGMVTLTLTLPCNV